MNRRTIAMLCLLVGLGVVSIVVWKSTNIEETSEAFNNQKAEYTCQSCHKTFTLTGSESVAALRSSEGIVCPYCGTPLNRKDVLAAKQLGSGDTSAQADAQPDDADTYDEPVKVTGGTLSKTGG